LYISIYSNLITLTFMPTIARKTRSPSVLLLPSFSPSWLHSRVSLKPMPIVRNPMFYINPSVLGQFKQCTTFISQLFDNLHQLCSIAFCLCLNDDGHHHIERERKIKSLPYPQFARWRDEVITSFKNQFRSALKSRMRYKTIQNV